jgi:phosphoglycolate phosphatase-like HAD superfamily hydrolase
MDRLLAMDLDDTLVSNHEVLLAWAVGMGIHPADESGYVPLTPAMTSEFVRTASRDPRFRMDALAGAADACSSLSRAGWNLVVVTARERDVIRESRETVDELFPGLFSDVVCVGSGGSKAAVLARLGPGS